MQTILTWRDCKNNPPDDHLTVLLWESSHDYVAWPGWKEGKRWFWSDGREVKPRPRLWADMPEPPKNPLRKSPGCKPKKTDPPVI